MAKKKRLIVDLDKETHDRLKAKAAREGRSLSEVIREYVNKYLKDK
jgi:predicted DNA-binding protein